MRIRQASTVVQNPRPDLKRGPAITRSRVESAVCVVPAPQVVVGRGAEVAVLDADAFGAY